ncbi:MAG: hypothetical protein Ct9H300mP13_6930 [Gammaproteobacteria bacterium]|nr:MAG: hypothetical protein Ct9H300mP13_6930 [Gammaproteobacteria bacterium]
MNNLDPITLGVCYRRPHLGCTRNAGTVFLTAGSVAIYEARDFSCGLFDAKGQVVAQSEDIGSTLSPCHGQ